MANQMFSFIQLESAHEGKLLHVAFINNFNMLCSKIA